LVYLLAETKKNLPGYYHRQNINRLEMRLQSPANWILY